MSSEKLNTAISTAKSITNWTAYFMNYDHIRKPNEFNIYKLPFATDTLLKDTITEMCDVFKNTVSDILPPPTLRLEAGASCSSTVACTVSAATLVLFT